MPVALRQRSALAERLGATLAAPGPIPVEAVEVDAGFHTGIPGLSAAGDVAVRMPSVANAVAAGASAAAMVVHALLLEPAPEAFTPVSRPPHSPDAATGRGAAGVPEPARS